MNLSSYVYQPINHVPKSIRKPKRVPHTNNKLKSIIVNLAKLDTFLVQKQPGNNYGKFNYSNTSLRKIL